MQTNKWSLEINVVWLCLTAVENAVRRPDAEDQPAGATQLLPTDSNAASATAAHVDASAQVTLVAGRVVAVRPDFGQVHLHPTAAPVHDDRNRPGALAVDRRDECRDAAHRLRRQGGYDAYFRWPYPFVLVEQLL